MEQGETEELYYDDDEDIVEILPGVSCPEKATGWQTPREPGENPETFGDLLGSGEDHETEATTASASSSSASISAATNSMLSLIADATLFSTEIKRLNEELRTTKATLEERELELGQCREELEQLRNNRFEFDGDVDNQDVREMKRMVASERKLRMETEERLANLKLKVGEVFGEFSSFAEEVKQDLEEREQQEEREVKARRQLEFEELGDLVRNKFQAWKENQNQLKLELASMTKTVVKLARILEMRKGGNGKLGKINGKVAGTPMAPPPKRPPPPPEDIEDTNDDLLHGEDEGKSSQGYFCHCGQQYSSRSNLRIHIRTLTEAGKFKCSECQQQFVLYYMLRRHLKDKHNINVGKDSPSIGCAECGDLFHTFLQLREHQKATHPNVGTPEKKGKQRHDELRNLAPVDPTLPRTRRSSVGPLNYAALLDNSDNDNDEVFEDDLNHTVFEQRTRSRSRSVSRSRQTPGPSSSLSESKISTEDNEDNYNDENKATVKHAVDPNNLLGCICGYLSNNKYNVTKHVTYHTVERHFTCKLCPGAFINTTYLKQHYQRSHKGAKLDLSEFKLGCSKCGENFPDRRSFTKHNMEVHYGVTNFFNKQPVANFRASKRLASGNLRSGRNERGQFVKGAVRKAQNVVNQLGANKKFPCTLCESSFDYLYLLRKHKRSVHKIVQRKFQIGCGDCGLSFSNRLDHVRHRIDVHKSAIGRRSKTPRPEDQEDNKPFDNVPEENTGDYEPEVIDLGDDDDDDNVESEPIPIPLNFEEGDDYVDYEAMEIASASRQDRDPLEDVSQVPLPPPPAAASRKQTIVSTSSTTEVVPQAHAVKGFQEGIGHFCICGTIFNEKKNLYSHIRRKTQEWNFTCKFCNKQFFYHATLKRHMHFTHKQMNIYKKQKGVGCVDCGNVFPTWNALRTHRATDHGVSEDPSGVQQQRKTPRSSPSRKSITPVKPPANIANDDSEEEAENVSTPKVQTAIKHDTDHSKAHIAAYCLCGKRFATEKALKLHIRYSTKERNIPCELCGLKFICPSYLKQHMQRTHKDSGVSVQTKRFSRCRKCGRVCNSNVELFRHMKIAHGVQRAKRKAVPASNQRNAKRTKTSNNSEDSANQANVIHKALPMQSGSIKQKCTCGREYYSAGGLRKHIRLNREGRVHRCNDCPKVFSEYNGLRRHTSAVHGVILQEGGHACGICAEYFDSHGDVIHHRKQAHGKVR